MKRATITFCFLSLLLLSTNGLSTNVMPPLSESPRGNSSPTAPVDHGAKIESKYDGFNHETVVTLKKMRITCGARKGLQSTLKETCVSFVASLHCPGVQLDHVRYAKVQLIFETKNWDQRHPLGERDLFVVADAERLKLGTMTLVTQNVDTSQLVEVMKEVLEVTVPYKIFNKIARSQSVEMKVGKNIFELQENNIAALQDLNNRVKF